MLASVKCPACSNEIIMQAVCPKCGFNIEIYEKAKRISIYLYNKGLEKVNEGKILDGITTIEKSLNFFKNNVVARNYLGLLYCTIGEVGEALNQWHISAKIKENDNPAIKYIEELQKDKLKLAKQNEAVKTYNEALMYLKQGNDDIAIIRLTKALNLSPELLKAQMLLTLCYMKSEDTHEKAATSLSKVLETDEESALVIYYAKILSDNECKTKEIKKKAKKKKAKDVKYYYPMGIKINKFYLTAICSVLLTLFFVFNLDGFGKIARDNTSLKEQNKELEMQIKKLTEGNVDMEERLTEYENEEQMFKFQTMLNEAINLYNTKNIIDSVEVVRKIDVTKLSAEDKERFDKFSPLVTTEASKLYIESGRDLFESNKFEEARLELLQVGEISKEAALVSESLYYLGRISEKQDKSDEAIKYYSAIMKDYPNTHIANQAEYRLNSLK